MLNILRIEKVKNFIILTLDRGSLGSWVDEDRSKLRVAMWTAGHMIIDMLNAYCALYIWFYQTLKFAELYKVHMVECRIFIWFEL